MAKFRFEALLFHRLASDGDLYAVAPEFFRRVLEYTQERGLRVISLEDWGNNRMGAHDYLALTFDDGWASDYEVAFPELAGRGLVGTFFISTALVGQDGYVNWTQLAEMSRAGMAIGSHTHRHPSLPRLSVPEIMAELKTSKSILEERLGIGIKALSLPHGDFSARILSLANEAGYQLVYTSIPGFHTTPANVLCRNVVHQRLNLEAVKSLLDFSRSAHIRLKGLYYAKRMLQKMLGPDTYKRLREVLVGSRISKLPIA